MYIFLRSNIEMLEALLCNGAKNSGGPGGSNASFPPHATITGQQIAWIYPGTYSFVVPAGVTSICGVAIGAGGGGWFNSTGTSSNWGSSGRGGGTGLSGSGTSGAARTSRWSNGNPGSQFQNSGEFGAGSGSSRVTSNAVGLGGGLRIMWGAGRAYPATNTLDA